MPELVVIRMGDRIVPVRDGVMQILGVYVGERTELEIPIEGVVDIEREMGVGVLVGLFENGVFEIVTEAEGAVAVVIIVHPLVGR